MRPLGSFYCLHGFTGAPSSFAALRLTNPVCGTLLGHGPVPRLSPRSFDAEVNEHLAFLEKIQRPVELLAYSMGSRIALGMLVKSPELFTRATLIGVNPGLEDDASRKARRAWEEEWIARLESDGIETFEKQWSQQPVLSPATRLDPDVQREQRRTRLSHTSLGLATALRHIGLGAMPNLWPFLKDLRVPTQLIVGESDRKFADIAERICSLSDTFRMNRLENCGHNPLLEAPDAVRKQLDQSA